MIRGIQIYDFNDNLIYDNNFARYSINLPIIVSVILDAKKTLVKEIEHMNVGQYKLSLMLEPDYTIGVLADRMNKDEELENFLKAVNKKLLELSNGKIETIFDDQEKRDLFDEEVENQIRKIPVKITFAGSGNVGKTTIVNLVAKHKIIQDYVPTIMADVEQLDFNLGVFSVSLFTVAGQKDYRTTWDIVAEATDIVVLVLDSTEGNLRETKDIILPTIRKYAPYSRYVAIANKQDLPNALPPAEIEEYIGLPTFGLIAIREDAKFKILGILQDIITTVP
ncbi:MAG: ADP-ribosylation factor-like protein [Candidatus Njordarchaeia archaeon]